MVIFQGYVSHNQMVIIIDNIIYIYTYIYLLNVITHHYIYL